MRGQVSVPALDTHRGALLRCPGGSCFLLAGIHDLVEAVDK